MSISECIQIIESRYHQNSSRNLNNNNHGKVNNDYIDYRNTLVDYTMGNDVATSLLLRSEPTHFNQTNPSSSAPLNFAIQSSTTESSLNDAINIGRMSTSRMNGNMPGIKRLGSSGSSISAGSNNQLPEDGSSNSVAGSRSNPSNTIHSGSGSGSSSGSNNNNTNKKCKVCSDKAVNQNFGVLSCESCKAFFRRNAIRSSPLKCSNGADVCSITSTTRKQCPCCRLKKCLLVGMRSDLIQIRKNNPKLNHGKKKLMTQESQAAKWPATRVANKSGAEVVSGAAQTLVPITIQQQQQQPNNNHQQQQMFWAASNCSSTSSSTSSGTASHGSAGTTGGSSICSNKSRYLDQSGSGAITQMFEPASIKYDLDLSLIKIKTADQTNLLRPIAILPSTPVYGISATASASPARFVSLGSMSLSLGAPPSLATAAALSQTQQFGQQQHHIAGLYGGTSYTTTMASPSMSIHRPASIVWPTSLQQSDSSATDNSTSSGLLSIYSCSSSSDSGSNSAPMPGGASMARTVSSNSRSSRSSSGTDPLVFSNSPIGGGGSLSCLPLQHKQMDWNFSDPGSSSHPHDDDDFQSQSNPNGGFDSLGVLLVDSTSNQSPSSTKNHQQLLLDGLADLWQSCLLCSQSVTAWPKVEQSGDLIGSSWETRFVRSCSSLFVPQLINFLSGAAELVRATPHLHGNCKMAAILDSVQPRCCMLASPPSSPSANQNNTNTCVGVEVLLPVLFSSHLQQQQPEIVPNDSSYPMFAELELSEISRHLGSDPRQAALQYLDRYCSGLANFLGPGGAPAAVFCLLKLLSVAPSGCSVEMRALFRAACAGAGTSVEQRLAGLDQFLTWGRAQFDEQWQNFLMRASSEAREEEAGDELMALLDDELQGHGPDDDLDLDDLGFII